MLPAQKQRVSHAGLRNEFDALLDHCPGSMNFQEWGLSIQALHPLELLGRANHVHDVMGRGSIAERYFPADF
jgi:hypothetical protein